MLRAAKLLTGLAAIVCAGPLCAFAQPADMPLAPALTTEYPDGIVVAKVDGISVYTARDGRTLYGLDTRVVHLWSSNPALYCEGRCTEWEPLLAPPGSEPNVFLRSSGGVGGAPPAPADGGRPGGGNGQRSAQQVPDWGIVKGPAGAQWIYKGWHMVYVRKGDKRRSAQFDGAENMMWNTLKFVPPAPRMAMPSGIKAAFKDEAYFLADAEGRPLFTGRCGNNCNDWEPLRAGFASQGVGEWSVSRDADQPQWTYRGKRVFVSVDADMASLPKSGVLLRP